MEKKKTYEEGFHDGQVELAKDMAVIFVKKKLV